MKILKDYLEGQEKIWVDINKEDFTLFLQFAKDNQCSWSNNKQINPTKDNCNHYMAIDTNLQLSYVPAYCWYIRADNSPIKYKFRELLGEKSMKKIITSESVNIGHPDKTCDVIADAFLDEAIRQDPNSMMAVECAIKDNKLFVYGEATTLANIDYDNIARSVLKYIGYKDEFEIIKQISKQSPDINQAVVKDDIGANDQGMAYGYATNESAEYMPMPILLAHKIMKKYEEFRLTNDNYYADAKCQVSIEYDNDKPTRIHTVLLSASHSTNISNEQIQVNMLDKVILPIIHNYPTLSTIDTNYIINPSGRFTIWGSYGDSGCVGRKIVVDTYGGVGRVGGGCFSSKNATKVDRSGAYYARYVAKNIVAHNLADRCEIQVSYGIGMSKPVSLYIDTFGTEKVDLHEIYQFVENNFDFSPKNMIEELDLLQPKYKETACYGHFGRNEFTWEKIKDIK